MNGICPGCERPTFRRPRSRHNGKRQSEPKPAGLLLAVNSDGECTTCWRARNGIVRDHESSGLVIHTNQSRPPMTDAELEIVRRALARMAEDRRARGVPVEGLDPVVIRPLGLSLVEV